MAVAIGTTTSCWYAGSRRTVPAVSRTVGLLHVVRPSLCHSRRTHRPTKRVTYLRPSNGRAAVEEHLAGQVRHQGLPCPDVDQHGYALVEPVHHLGVGPVDRVRALAVQPLQGVDRGHVAVCRDPPVHVLDGDGLVPDGVGEQRQTDVHNRHLGRQHDLRCVRSLS